MEEGVIFIRVCRFCGWVCVCHLHCSERINASSTDTVISVSLSCMASDNLRVRGWWG